MWPTSSRHHPEQGAYTAELAVALPALVVLAAACMLGIGYAGATLRCDDASRAGARAMARGEPVAAVEAAAKAAAPQKAHIEIRRHDKLVEVRCSAHIRVAGLRTVEVHSRSVAAVEQTTGPPPVPGEPSTKGTS